MMGRGKFCRYELHHPMSLGDLLAALFRSSRQQAVAENVPDVAEEPDSKGPKSTKLLTYEDREEMNAVGVQLK